MTDRCSNALFNSKLVTAGAKGEIVSNCIVFFEYGAPRKIDIETKDLELAIIKLDDMDRATIQRNDGKQIEIINHGEHYTVDGKVCRSVALAASDVRL